MNEAIIEEIKSTAASLDAAKDEIRKSIRELEDPAGNKLTFDRPLPSVDYTIEDIFAGLSSLFGLVTTIDVKENAPFVPKVLLTALNSKINDIKGNLDSLRNL